MNATPNSLPESAGVTAPGYSAAATRPFYWSVWRELWENRSIYMAPLIVAVVVLFGFLVSTAGLPERRRAVLLLDPAKARVGIEAPYDMAALMLILTAFIVGVFYCLDALYGERRDRSILFWKSMPVSDTTVVLSKMTVPVVVVPLTAFALTVGVHLIMLLLGSMIFQGSGIGAATLWRHVPLVHKWAVLFVHLVPGHGLAFAPLYAWLLLVSAWARRTPFLWAVLPPVAIAGAEKIAFNTSYFVAILLSPFTGGTRPSEPTSTMSMDAMTPPLGDLLSNPWLWIGFVVAAAFLMGAIRLRRARGPI